MTRCRSMPTRSSRCAGGRVKFVGQNQPFGRVNRILQRETIQYWIQVARWSLIILLVFEIVIRIFVVKAPQRENIPGLGIVPVENSYSIQGTEGYGMLRYLADGEVETPYRDGISIVILGDSTVHATQVNPNDNFVSLTEVALRQRGFVVDMHNLGRSDRTVADHVFIAPAVNALYAPKYVIVQLSPANFSLAYDDTKENYFIDKGNGNLELVHQELTSSGELAFRNVISDSGLLTFLDFRAQITSADLFSRYSGMFSKPQNANDDAPRQTENKIFQEQVDSQVKALMDVFPDSRIIFLVIPYSPSISLPPEERISWSSPGDRYLATLLAKIEGVEVVYTQKVFEEFYKKDGVFPRGNFNSAFNFGHLNKYGHISVAQALTDALVEILK